MPSRDTTIWFARGFALTTLALLLVAALVVPAAGWAQGGGNNTGPQTLPGGSPPSWRTDDPLGRAPSPVDETAAVPNDLWLASLPTSPQVAGPSEPGGLAPQAVYGSPLVIPAADFRADGFFPDSAHFWFNPGEWEGTTATYGCLMAPAYLPAGANVYQVWASVVDNDAIDNVTVILSRVDNYSGIHDTMATIATAGITTTIQSLSAGAITYPVISYPNYSYYATTCLHSASTKLYSVRIWYTLP
jgi:hypothetical protein